MSKAHYEKLLAFKGAIEGYLKNIFQVYGMELELRLEELNLLDNPQNGLETSTAIGYILEEFLVSKLEIYTGCFLVNGEDGFRINRRNGATTEASFDCYGMNDDIMVLINIKSSKGGEASNAAVAAIHRMVEDYVNTNPPQKKAFMVLKISYDIGKSKNPLTPHRKIRIMGISSFYIDEIDISKEHRQDNRSWSKKSDSNSGRLIVSEAFRKTHLLSPDCISYENTCDMLKKLISRNANT